jgi:hypothetical protein
LCHADHGSYKNLIEYQRKNKKITAFINGKKRSQIVIPGSTWKILKEMELEELLLQSCDFHSKPPWPFLFNF